MAKDRRSAPAVLAFAALLGAHGATATAAPGGSPGNSCFTSVNWDAWSATADGDALYLRVGLHDIYRVDLTPGSHVRKEPDYFLVNRLRGSSWICSPLDLDLTLSDHQGFQRPLIARSLRKLTPAEVAAIPRKELP